MSHHAEATEIFRTSDILDPRILGGDFSCEVVSKDSLNLLINNLSDEVFEHCDDYDDKSESTIRSLRMSTGVANNLQFNSYLIRSPTRFATFIFNQHTRDKQYTISTNFFDSGDKLVPNFRLEFEYSDYSLTRTEDKKSEQLYRTQWYARVENFGNSKNAYEVGFRSFFPIPFSKLSTEVDFKHRFGIKEQKRTELVLAYYRNESSDWKITSRFDAGVEWTDGSFKSTFFRAEIARRFRIGKGYIQLYLAPIYSNRRNDNFQIESGIIFGRLILRESKY